MRRLRTIGVALAGLLLMDVGIVLAPAVFMAEAPWRGIAGVLVALGGGCLFALTLYQVLRRRRRLVQVAVGLVATVVVLQWVVTPAVTAGLATNAPRRAVPAAATLGLAGVRDVRFPAKDGTVLSGWFVPARNHAVVVLLHGSHGDRTSTLPYARFLNRVGFGVLAYDARGHGKSGGRTNALGWRGADDLAGAVAFVTRRLGHPRVGVLGLSMGAEEALRGAAEGVPVRAIVADGAGASTAGDERLVSHGLLSGIRASVGWLAMRQVEIASLTAEPRPLSSLVGRIGVPTLLIASRRSDERALDAAYRARIGARATLWFVPDAGHTRAFVVHPRAYAARVTRFLSVALR
jgi:uncharacterized protein